MADVNFGWLTTAPHPTRQYSWDRGQRGWRLHAVLLPEGELPKDGRGLVALCGLSPRRGWGLDLFIEDECSRCHAAMTRREAGRDVFIDLPAKQAAEREAARLAAEEAEYQRELLEPFKGAKHAQPH